LDTMKFI